MSCDGEGFVRSTIAVVVLLVAVVPSAVEADAADTVVGDATVAVAVVDAVRVEVAWDVDVDVEGNVLVDVAVDNDDDDAVLDKPRVGEDGTGVFEDDKDTVVVLV